MRLLQAQTQGQAGEKPREMRFSGANISAKLTLIASHLATAIETDKRKR